MEYAFIRMSSDCCIVIGFPLSGMFLLVCEGWKLTGCWRAPEPMAPPTCWEWEGMWVHAIQ